MIVIYRNGVPTVVTGWRAWLIMLAAALAFVVIAGPRSRDRADRLDGAAVRPAADDPVRADRHVVAVSTMNSAQTILAIEFVDLVSSLMRSPNLNCSSLKSGEWPDVGR